MARKTASNSSEGHGRHDIIGVIFFALSVIVLIALFTYDRKDLGIHSAPGNLQPHNLIGTIGGAGSLEPIFRIRRCSVSAAHRVVFSEPGLFAFV